MSTLDFLNTCIDGCRPGYVHNVWSLTSTYPFLVYTVAIDAKMLVHCYPISMSHTSTIKSRIFPCCGDEDETMSHFLVKCRSLALSKQIGCQPSSNTTVERYVNRSGYYMYNSSHPRPISPTILIRLYSSNSTYCKITRLHSHEVH